MNRLLPLKLTHRQRRIWWSVLGVLLGTAAITALAMWVQVSRNTDLGDPTAGITDFDTERAAAAPDPLPGGRRGGGRHHGPPQHRRLCGDTGPPGLGRLRQRRRFRSVHVSTAEDDAAPLESSGSHLFRKDSGSSRMSRRRRANFRAADGAS
jgi:hypothetical protein